MLGKFSDLKVWFLHKRDHKSEPLPRNANADIFKNVKRTSGLGDSQNSPRSQQNRLGSVNTNIKIPTEKTPLEQTTTSSRLAGNDMPPFLNTNKYTPPAENKDKGYSYPEVKDEYELSPRDEDHLYYSPGEPLTPRRRRVDPFPAPEDNVPPPSQHVSASAQAVPDGELSDNTVLSGDNAEQKNQDLKSYHQEHIGQNESYDTQTTLPIPEPQNSSLVQEKSSDTETAKADEETADEQTTVSPQQFPFADSAAPEEEKDYHETEPDEQSRQSALHETMPLRSTVTDEPQESPNTEYAEENILNKTDTGLTERVQEPIPELTKVKTSDNSDADNTARIGLPLIIYLYFRQIIAAFFTHTSLNILFPRTALKLGPCYPSSMPIPFFIIGLAIGGSTYWFQTIPDGLLPAVIALTLFVGLTGTSGFRGFISMVSTFSKRQPDSCLQAVCVCFYSMMFTAIYTVVTMIYPIDLGFVLAVAVVFMVSACAATSLNYGMRQNPIDFYGSLSLGGLFFCMLITAAAAYTVLNPYMATSILGIAVLVRVLCGHMLYLSHARASKNLVGGVLYLVLIFVLTDILVFSSRISLLNPLFFR